MPIVFIVVNNVDNTVAVFSTVERRNNYLNRLKEKQLDIPSVSECTIDGWPMVMEPPSE